jgi:hypothetical protein
MSPQMYLEYHEGEGISGRNSLNPVFRVSIWTEDFYMPQICTSGLGRDVDVCSDTASCAYKLKRRRDMGR